MTMCQYKQRQAQPGKKLHLQLPYIDNNRSITSKHQTVNKAYNVNRT